jgi:hypothetical protein
MNRHSCNIENAPKFWEWIQNRGGVAVWRSADLSDPGKSWSTPATIRKGDCEGQTGDEIIPYPKVSWQMQETPEFVVKDPTLIDVFVDEEVKRFHVAVRQAGGFRFKCTDASSRRIRKEVEKAGKGAYYEFDYDMQEAVILRPSKKITLLDWARENGKVAA